MLRPKSSFRIALVCTSVISGFYFFSVQKIDLTEFRTMDNFYMNGDNIYSDAIVIKFNKNVIALEKGIEIARLENIDAAYSDISYLLSNLEKRYGTLQIEKVVPSAVWGDVYRTHRITGESVKLKDMSQIFKLNFPNPIPLDSVICLFEVIPEIEYVQQTAIYKYDEVPNDPLYQNNGQWHLGAVNAANTWDITHGSSTIKIGIVDEGIMLNHQDLVGKKGGGNRTFSLSHPHGTMVAGVLCGNTNNNLGIASLGWDLQYYNYGTISSSVDDLVHLIDIARNAGMDIINMSFGIFAVAGIGDIPGGCPRPDKWVGSAMPFDYEPMSDAISNAVSQGIVCIASAGNTSLNDGPSADLCDPMFIPFLNYPSEYPGVMAISATQFYNNTEQFKSGWNYGSHVDVSAPGVGILTTNSDGGYLYVSGTSFSSPLTCALAGLILSINSTLTVQQIETIIEASTDKIPAPPEHPYNSNGWSEALGYGRINAYKALKYTLENYGGTLAKNFTIPSGETWTIQPGITIKLSSGVTLTINGNLIADGTPSSKILFDRSGTSGTWGSISFNGSGANNSILENVIIQNGTRIEAINTTNISISNCQITSMYDGIRFSGSTGNILNNNISTTSFGHGIIFENSSTAISCSGNTLTKSSNPRSGVGIYFGGGSNGTAKQNNISGWDWGIGAIWGSSPNLFSNNQLIEGNKITNCRVGVEVYNNSWPILGKNSNGSGYNSIYNNSYKNVYFTSGGLLWAQKNYWGGTPTSSMFYLGSGCTINTDYWLVTDPGASLDKGSITISNQENRINADSQTEVLEFGNSLLNKNENKKAQELFLSYLSEHPDDQSAYVQLYNCYNKETENELINYFNSLPPSAAQEHKLLLSYLYLKQNNSEMAEKVNNEIIKENPNTELEAEARINNIYIALYNENDYNKVINIYSQLIQHPELSTPLELSLVESAITSYAIHQEYSSSTFDKLKINSGKINITDDYSLSANYPNPFNPVTTIKYSIKEDGQVKIRVYDLLGNEIKELVNESQPKGNYLIEFDASDFSSGVYFYTLQVNNYSTTKKMILLK